MASRRKTARADNAEVPPTAPRENQQESEEDQRLKNYHDRFRNKYPEIRGRRVDWIDYSLNDGLLYVGVRFMDGTYFSLVFGPQIITDLVEFSDRSSGNEVILKTYFLRKES